MIKRSALIAIASTAFCISAACAGEFDMPYTSLNTGESYANNVNYQGHAQSGFFEGWGANLFMGAPVNRYFAPEVGISYFAVGSIGKVGILGLEGRFTIPFEKVLLFAKGGIALGELRTCYQTGCKTTDNTLPAFGAGIGYAFTPDWVGTVEYNGAWVLKEVANGYGPLGLITIGVTRFWNI